jgi:UMF1 family MFS transporter
MSLEYSAREQRAWYLYDWANSAFFTTVIALFLGPYLTSIAKAAADADGLIHPLGIPVDARSYWSYMISLSVVLQVFVLPIIGALADFGRRKKEYLAATAYVGSIATIGLFFVEGTAYLLGGVLFLIANVAFGASVVVYNSFLPEIAPPEQQDAVSSRGWAIGYAGGGTLLALNLLLYTKASTFGITEAMAVRISLASAGVWAALFTIPAMLSLRNRGPAKSIPEGSTAISTALSQLWHTIREVKNYPETSTFLIAYLLYNDAIQTVLAMATQFGNDELKIPVSSLTIAILLVQFAAVLGALLFNKLSVWMSAKRAILLALAAWTFVPVYAYFFVNNTAGFFVLAGIVALVMGGSQALSRSLFSQFIPKGKEAEYFSIYEISDKGTSWIGPIVFGLALQFTKSYRSALLSLIAFFVLGFLILSRVNVEKGQREVLFQES